MIARWFWREWRSPSLLIVVAGAGLAVACVLALGHVSDRMEKGLSEQSRSLWRAMGVAQFARSAASMAGGKRKARPESRQAADFRDHKFAGDTPQLANFKAVESYLPNVWRFAN